MWYYIVVQEEIVHTTRSVAKLTGLDQDTVRKYAAQLNLGRQPGGPGTPRFFTKADIDLIYRRRDRRRRGEVRVIGDLKIE